MEERKDTAFNNTNVKLIKDALSTLEGKRNKIYFFCMDSKGAAMAAIATIYEHAKILRELGYNAIILTEKADYTKPGSWMGEEYDEIPHETLIEQLPQIIEMNDVDLIWLPRVLD